MVGATASISWPAITTVKTVTANFSEICQLLQAKPITLLHNATPSALDVTKPGFVAADSACLDRMGGCSTTSSYATWGMKCFLLLLVRVGEPEQSRGFPPDGPDY